MTFDKAKYANLLKQLKEDFDVFTEEYVRDPLIEKFNELSMRRGGVRKSRLVATFPKVELLIETIKGSITLRETGKELPDDQLIKKIELFTSRISDKDYKIVVNGDYRHPLEVSRSFKTWDRFFRLIESGSLELNGENHDLYDYLNFNPRNLLTTNTKYPLQSLIKQFDNEYRPLFKASVSTEKALVQRKDKGST